MRTGRAVCATVSPVDFHLITCIVERGRAERVADEALSAGAQGVTIFHGRGRGVRERLGIIGHLIDPEKEIILVVASANNVRAIFDRMVEAARIDQPGRGFAYVQPVSRVAGYIDPSKLLPRDPARVTRRIPRRAVRRKLRRKS